MKTNLKKKIILGIETSCDDTAISIVDSKRNILSNVIVNQNNYHKKYGGIVPEIAARAHMNFINKALEESLNKAKKKNNRHRFNLCNWWTWVNWWFNCWDYFCENLILDLKKTLYSC